MRRGRAESPAWRLGTWGAAAKSGVQPAQSSVWHYQHRPGVGPGLAARRKGQPARVIAIADTAQQRLCRRFRRLTAEHKPAPKVVVAVARELAGFIWAALQKPSAA